MSNYNGKHAHRIVELAENGIQDIRILLNEILERDGDYPPEDWWVQHGPVIRNTQDYLEALYSIIQAEREREGIESLRHVRTEQEQKLAERSAIRKSERRDWYLEERATHTPY